VAGAVLLGVGLPEVGLWNFDDSRTSGTAQRKVAAGLTILGQTIVVCPSFSSVRCYLGGTGFFSAAVTHLLRLDD
jgi:hypothetical protein